MCTDTKQQPVGRYYAIQSYATKKRASIRSCIYRQRVRFVSILGDIKTQKSPLLHFLVILIIKERNTREIKRKPISMNRLSISKAECDPL